MHERLDIKAKVINITSVKLQNESWRKKKSVTLKYPFIKKKSKAWNSVAELLYSGLNTAFNRENFQVYLHIYIYNAGSGEESTGSTDTV